MRLNNGFKKALMALETQLFPDQEGSIVLKMTFKPVLSSSRRGINRK